MVLLCMVTWIPSIYPSHVSINIPAPWILWVMLLTYHPILGSWRSPIDTWHPRAAQPRTTSRRSIVFFSGPPQMWYPAASASVGICVHIMEIYIYMISINLKPLYSCVYIYIYDIAYPLTTGTAPTSVLQCAKHWQLFYCVENIFGLNLHHQGASRQPLHCEPILHDLRVASFVDAMPG